jgi:glycosyltransferase involved in cell wall biosynthesis
VKPIKICLVSQRSYPPDARLSLELQALAEHGYETSLVIWRAPQQPLFAQEGLLRIYRLPAMKRLRASKLRYLLEYLSFFVPAAFLLPYLHLRHRFDIVHVTNLPDPLVFVGLIPKLLGAKIVFELREITPEMFMDRFGARADSWIIRVMAFLERLSVRFADGAITTNPAMLQAILDRGSDARKFQITLNVGEARITSQETILPEANGAHATPFEIYSHGTILKRQGYEVLIRAMPLIVKQVPQARLTILGRGEYLPQLMELVEAFGLQACVALPGFLTGQALIDALRHAHVGVVPVLLNPETTYSQTHKMYEYIHLGIPVIVSRTPAVEATFDERHVAFIEPGSPESLAEAVIDLACHPQKRRLLAETAFDYYARELSPEQQRRRYIEFLRRLTS